MSSPRSSLVRFLTVLALAAPMLAFADAPAILSSPVVEQGRYVAQLGDCIACHTSPGGREMAGGLALDTPFGTLYSTNITPHAATGIGGYTFEQFDRAMRKGVAADGHNLYPAMPYPSYARITDEDMRALYAYLMHGVAPVGQANRASTMYWPFSMRWGLSLWNAAFLPSDRFVPDSRRDAIWNRGAYLVQGLGHCGSCHTPRGIAFQEKALSESGRDGQQYLSGETVEGWRALSLRNLWTVDDTVQLLKTGQNRFATASGNMVEVIHRSTQHFTDADALAVATYLKSLPAGPEDLPMPAVPATESDARVPEGLFTTAGGLGYVQFCIDCHRNDGAGVPGIFPSLVQNPTVAAREPATLLHIMLTGWKTAETTARPRVWTMPAFARLGDSEIAEILTFVGANWGQGATRIAASDVAAARKSLQAGSRGDEGFDTPRLSRMLAEPNAAQLVRGMRLNLQTGELLRSNVGNALNCTSCHLNAGTVADGSPYVGVSAFFPSYAPRAGKVITLEERINGCFKRSMDGKPLPIASDEMKAMVAYFDWMKRNTRPEDKVAGRGVGKIDTSLKPDQNRGQAVYSAQCAACHGPDGEGLKNAAGRYLYPPLWGAASFNLGAGMARTYTAAAFVKRNMPIGYRQQFPLGQGGLSDQDAVDVAYYFAYQPRPDFPEKINDWPKDKKPIDARY